MSNERVLQAFDETMAAEMKMLKAKVAELEGKLLQDPKDARCQLYKQTQRYAREAGACTKYVDKLEARLSDAQIRVEKLEGSLGLAEDEIKRLTEERDDAVHCHKTSDEWRSRYQTEIKRLRKALEGRDEQA